MSSTCPTPTPCPICSYDTTGYIIGISIIMIIFSILVPITLIVIRRSSDEIKESGGIPVLIACGFLCLALSFSV